MRNGGEALANVLGRSEPSGTRLVPGNRRAREYEVVLVNEIEARQMLGVETGASSSQLKAAYRKMVKLWHPDRFASDSISYREAIQRTQRLNAAYRLLGGHGVRTESDELPSPIEWGRSAIRKRMIRNRLLAVVTSVALYAGISWIVHDLILGL